MCHAITTQKKEELAISISERIDFKVRDIRNKEEHYIMIQGSSVQDNTSDLNAYVPNNRLPYMKQKLIEMQGEIDEFNYRIRDYKPLFQKTTHPAGRKSAGTWLNSPIHSIIRYKEKF